MTRNIILTAQLEEFQFSSESDIVIPVDDIVI